MELRRLSCTVVAVIYMLVIKQQLDSKPLWLQALIGRRQSRESRSCDGYVTSRCLPRPESSGKQRAAAESGASHIFGAGLEAELFNDAPMFEEVPAEDFMAPDEASSLCIMHAAVVLYRLCSCAEYIVSPINQLQRLHGTIFLSVDYKKV